MDVLSTDHSEARAALWCELPRFRFSNSWDFVPVADEMRGCCARPKEVLKKLRRRFECDALRAAGIAVLNKWGESQLAAELCNPLGAVVQVSTVGARLPCDFWTCRGRLSDSKHPALSIMQDAESNALATNTGVVFVVSRIQEVVLLRSLGIPAVTGPGMSRMSWEELRGFEAVFGEGVPVRDTESEFAESEEIEESMALFEDEDEDDGFDGVPEFVGATRPALVLLGFRLLPISPDLPSWVWHTAAHLATAREQGRLALSDVWVARPDGSILERLRFAVRHRDASAIRELLLETAHTAIDFDALFESEDATPNEVDYATAHDALRRIYSVIDKTAVDAFELDETVRQYQEVVDRLLWRPLVEWAMQKSDPVIRNAGVQLASVGRTLHELSPRFTISHDLLHSPQTDGHFDRYLRALDRFSRLVAVIEDAMK